MNWCRETAKMGVQPGNRRVLVSVPERYVAGSDTRGRLEGRPYPWSQQVIDEISGLGQMALRHLSSFASPAFLLLWILATNRSLCHRVIAHR